MVGSRKRLSGDSRRSSEKASSRVLQGTVARMFLADVETLALLHLDRTNWEGLYPFGNNGVAPCIVAHG